MDTAAEVTAVEAVGKAKEAAETATVVVVMAEAAEVMVTVGAGRERVVVVMVMVDTQANPQVTEEVLGQMVAEARALEEEEMAVVVEGVATQADMM